jgi:predicted outer membrane repeat protein
VLAFVLALGATALIGAAPARAADLTAGSEAELNAAIAAANAAGAGTHTITLTADVTLTNPTTALDNPAATQLILDGDGHTIDGHGHGPILRVVAGTTARIHDVTLTGGQANAGAAILNGGMLTVENSTLSGNSAAASGGGIHSAGDVTILSSRLDGNTANSGGAVALTTAAITATLIIRNTTIANNTAQVTGGGVAEFTANNIIVQGNHAPGGTGGLDLSAGPGSSLEGNLNASQLLGNDGARGGLAVIAQGAAEFTVAGSTVAGNVATGPGGSSESSAGVYARSDTGGTALLTLFNTTLSGNTTNRAGGGVLVVANGGAAGANVVYSTLAGNTAAAGGGGVHTMAANGGVASVRLSAAIITNGSGAGPDCAQPSGAIISIGFNLAGDGTCFLNQGSDWPASPALLLPLAQAAPGKPATYALRFGSPAIDRIPRGGLGCGTAIATDQRGAPRPQPTGTRCDIGAFERQAGETPEFGIYLPLVAHLQ